MAKFKRKKKLINSRLQLKMIGVFLAVSCVASLFQVVLLNRSMIDMARRLPTEGDRLLSYLPGVLTSNVLLTGAVLGPLTFLVGLLVTHRIAGPAYNMTRYCQALARGEERGACHIRTDDELWELCDALNAAVAKLREQHPQSADADGQLDQAPSLPPGEEAAVEAGSEAQA